MESYGPWLIALTGHSPRHLKHRMHSGEEGCFHISMSMGQTLPHFPHRMQASATLIRMTETFPSIPQAAPSGQRYLQKGLSTDMASSSTVTARALFQAKRNPVR